LYLDARKLHKIRAIASLGTHSLLVAFLRTRFQSIHVGLLNGVF
jgi:hypothetical protein